MTGLDLLHEARRLGLEVHARNGDEAVARCPICGKERHLYFNISKQVFECKRCGAAGTYLQLCGALCVQAKEDFTPDEKERLAQDRALPVAAFEDYEIGVCGAGFLLPVRDADGGLRDVRQYTPRQKTRSTAGLTVGLFGAPRLAVTDRRHEPVYVCEGEWDAIAMEWLRKAAGKPGIVVGVPGANTFKDQWRGWFQGREVFLCYDNDDPGRLGSARAAQKLIGVASEVHVLTWPPDAPEKMDIRDMVMGVTHAN
jgi:hypothetical protein